MKRFAALASFGCLVFLAAYAYNIERVRAQPRPQRTLPPPDAPDSVHLAALGYRSGPQLIVYVLGGSGCGFCQVETTKQSMAAVRRTLASRYVSTGSYASVIVIGVAVDTDLRTGLEYLESFGLDAFDQISIGSGWQNDNVVRLLRREKIAEAALPVIIVSQRSLSAHLEPLSLVYSASDTVMRVIQGGNAIKQWAEDEMPIHGSEVPTVGQR